MVVALYWLLSVIHLTSSLNVDIPLTTYEFARGANGVIPCKFQPAKPTNSRVTISWVGHPDLSTDSDITILNYFYTLGEQPELDISPEFADRASIQVDIAKGWGNLTLNSLKSQDSRVFECKVTISQDITGKVADTTTVVVLVAPSPPICAIQGKVEFYQNISLTCHSEEGMPEPTYKWQSYDVTNNSRPNPPKATDVKGVLSLFNISAETSGYYVCTSSNKIRSVSCNLTLTVMPYSMNLGSTAAIAGGCAAALVLLVIIICCCCHHRRKKAAEEYAMGSREDGEDGNTEQQELKEYQDRPVESKAGEYDDNHYDRDDRQGRPDNRQNNSDRRSDRYDDRRDDRRGDRYDDRRSDYDDRRSDRYDDRRSDYDDRRSDRYDDRRSDYDDRRSDRYDDRRSDYDDRRNERYNDRRRQDDRFDDRRVVYDHPDDDRSRTPNVPANKPTRG